MNLKKYGQVAVLLGMLSCSQQIQNVKTEVVEISGNCDMCKANIEKAGTVENTSNVIWSTDAKMARITYDSLKSTKSEILKKIALSGYDNQEFRAPDAAYNALPDCCKYVREVLSSKSPEIEEIMMDSAKSDTIVKEIVENQISGFEDLFDRYFELKDALIMSSSKTAKVKAVELKLVLTEIATSDLTDEEKKVFLELKTSLLFDIDHIAETSDLAHQRDHFSSLSESFYKLAMNADLEETIYYQNCPMFSDGKGANWLSRENAIKNPYYGSSMLSCGKTIETIK